MVKTASTMKKIGTPAPDFTLMNVDGRELSLRAGVRPVSNPAPVSGCSRIHYARESCTDSK